MRHLLWAVVLSVGLSGLAQAQDVGPVTNLPLPRFVSMKASEGFARRGPGRTHKIDWVYKHRNQPLEITAEFGHWRRVRDQDGFGGWMHYSLLSGVRTVLVTTDFASLHRAPDAETMVTANAEMGAVARLLACVPAWCEISAGGGAGWIKKSDIWGVNDDEVFE